jgi:hypothetical protein
MTTNNLTKIIMDGEIEVLEAIDALKRLGLLQNK